METAKARKTMASRVAPWRRSAVIFFVALLSCSTARARIGENEAEVRGRYGNPVFILPSTVENSLTKCYLSGGFSIAVTYMKGRSVRETFAKADRSKLTEKEIERFLKGNAGGAIWNAQELAGKKGVPAGLLSWRTDDEPPRVALYDERTEALFITTQRFISQTNAANRREAARNNRKAITARETEQLLKSLQYDRSFGPGPFGAGGQNGSPSNAGKGVPSK